MSRFVWGFLWAAAIAAVVCNARSSGLSDPSTRGVPFGRSLRGSKNTAKSQTSISVVVEEGSASAVASSISQGFALEEAKIVNKIIEAISRAKAGGNVTTESELAASTIGNAVATAITESEVFVNVTGDGFARADSSGGAKSIALSTAKAILLGVTEASNDDKFAVSLVNITALSEEIAKAAVDVSLSVNSTGGPKEDFRRRIAVAVAKPIAEVITNVLVTVDNDTAGIRDEFQVISHQGEIPISETSIRDDPTVVTTIVEIEDPKEEIGRKIESVVTEAIGDAIDKSGIQRARKNGESNSTDSGKAFAFAFAFAGVGVTVSGEGYASGSGPSQAQEIANITAKAIALALAGAANNDTGSVAEVKVTLTGKNANQTTAQQETEAEASVEPVAQVVASVLSDVGNGVARSKSSASGSGSSGSQPESSSIEEEKDHRAASPHAIIAEHYDEKTENQGPHSPLEEAPADVGSDSITPEVDTGDVSQQRPNQKIESETEGSQAESEGEGSNQDIVPNLVPSSEESNAKGNTGAPDIVVIEAPTIAEGSESMGTGFAPTPDGNLSWASGSPDAEGEGGNETGAGNQTATKPSTKEQMGSVTDGEGSGSDMNSRDQRAASKASSKEDQGEDDMKDPNPAVPNAEKVNSSASPPKEIETGHDGGKQAVAVPSSDDESKSTECDSESPSESAGNEHSSKRHTAKEEAASPVVGEVGSVETVDKGSPEQDESMLERGKNASEGGENCCYYALRSSPFPVCGQHCDPRVCNRGYGVYPSMDACCQKGAAFKNGCQPPPEKCFVIERHGHVCREDQTKCLQGSKMWGSMEECCRPGNGFGKGCKKLDGTEQKCWIPGNYHPVKECIETNGDVCNRGWGSWQTKAECCKRGNAFSEGCGKPLPTPCWVKGIDRPVRLCRKEESIAACYRGWGTYTTKEECCSKKAAFKKGCSKPY